MRREKKEVETRYYLERKDIDIDINSYTKLLVFCPEVKQSFENGDDVQIHIDEMHIETYINNKLVKQRRTLNVSDNLLDVIYLDYIQSDRNDAQGDEIGLDDMEDTVDEIKNIISSQGYKNPEAIEIVNGIKLGDMHSRYIKLEVEKGDTIFEFYFDLNNFHNAYYADVDREIHTKLKYF